MDPVQKQRIVFAHVWATIVVCILLLQTLLAGAAVAEAGGDVGFGVICATQPAPGADQQPAHQSHRHGLCCILHSGALDAPPPAPQAFVAAIDVVVGTLESPTMAPAPATRLEPKGAPQSPRAPPSSAAAFS